jgi:hypothetical protein
MRPLRLLTTAATLCTLVALAGCQSLPFPVPSGSGSASPQGGQGSGQSGGGSGGDVDTSAVTGAPVADGLVDPCSLLTLAEIEAATGVSVTAIVRGALQTDGSQICAYAMDAQGATASAMAGIPGMPAGGLGDEINGLEAGGAVVGVIVSAQDPNVDYSAADDGDTPSQIQAETLALGKGGVAIGTPNGGAAFVANDHNVLLTIMDLIAGPASVEGMKTLATTAYLRL